MPTTTTGRFVSRRAAELGTENAFVVLGEVGRLQAAGKDIVSFCIGQPDFPTPDHIRLAGIRAITDGQDRLHALARDPRPARGGRRLLLDARAGSTVAPERRGLRLRRQAVHRVRDPVGHRVRGRATRSSSPTPASRSTRRRSRRTAPCRSRCRCARRAASASTSTSCATKINDKTRLLILCSPQQPDGKPAVAARSSRRSRRSCAPLREPLDLLRRGLLGAGLRRRLRTASPRSPACASARSSPTRRRRPTP